MAEPQQVNSNSYSRKNTAQNAADCRDITIAPGNKVIYDKIIQIMDVAREVGFSNVSISKVRG